MLEEEKYYLEDDLSLWNKFTSGDDAVYNYIYSKYAKILFVQGLQFTGNKELVRDLIHDLFVKIYKNRATLKPVLNIRLYLFVALKNSIITESKKNLFSFSELDDQAEYLSENTTIEDKLINKETEDETTQLIETIFSLLTSRQKEVINYRLIQNLSMDEICTLMDMNYQSVQNLLQRSIKKIRDYFKKEELK